MSDTTKRDAVLKEFGAPHMSKIVPSHFDTMLSMADKIVQLGERLAAVEAERDDYKRMYLDLWDSAKRHQDERKVFCDRANRAERILAALREPSKAVVEEAASKMHDASEPDGDCRIAWEDCIPWYHITRRKMATAAIRAAVATAEKEVEYE